jgi:hypothetical protein
MLSNAKYCVLRNILLFSPCYVKIGFDCGEYDELHQSHTSGHP